MVAALASPAVDFYTFMKQGKGNGIWNTSIWEEADCKCPGCAWAR